MRYFTAETLRFLDELARHNEREWFEKNKARYESSVKEPAMRLVGDVGPKLGMRGKVMRIYRDIRFSKDKSPYKTNIGIGFHPPSKVAEGPLVGGVYLHVQPKESFIATGCWMPEAALLAKIRSAIDDNPTRWKGARKVGLDDDTETLKRMPRGYPEDHPFAADLRRKSFTASRALTPTQVTSDELPKLIVAEEKRLRPLNEFLIAALE